MTSNMLCFILMPLVISRLSWFRWAEIIGKECYETPEIRHKSSFYLQSSWLSPNGTTVFSFWIKKFSLITNTSLSTSLETCWFASLSMMMNHTCLLKLCPCCWNYLQAWIDLGFFVSFLCFFNLRLNVLSAFPAYWFLHSMHSIK